MKTEDKSMWRKKLQYHFDQWMSKGAVAQFVILFICIAIIGVVIGVLCTLIKACDNTGAGVWQSLCHIIDAGTLTADDTTNKWYIILMGTATLCGMVLMGALISILNNALDRKLNDLQRGHSQIIEKNHTVILGFDENIYCILEELILSNENTKGCIVIIDDLDKEEMEFMIHSKIPDTKTTKIVCRRGDNTQKAVFKMVSLNQAKSIILNEDNDFYVLRMLLAITEYFDESGCKRENTPLITTLLHKETSRASAMLATEKFNCEIMCFEATLSKIIAQVCRQPGLSQVFSELFSYNKSEIYFENKYKDGTRFNFAGKSFRDTLCAFENACVLGIRRGKQIMLCPDSKMVMEEEDDLILLSPDDGETLAYKDKSLLSQETLSELVTCDYQRGVKHPMHLLVLDWNITLPDIIRNLDEFVVEGSTVLVVSDRTYDFENQHYQNMSVKFQKCDNLFDIAVLEKILEEEDFTNILLVCEDGITPEEADAQTSMLLLHLRKLLHDLNKVGTINVTSEMEMAEDQQLLQGGSINDFVVGSEITNRILAQISNERELRDLYTEILTSRGAEIYIRDVQEYLPIGTEASFEQLQMIVNKHCIQSEVDGKAHGDILMGWKIYDEQGKLQITLNPEKGIKRIFNDKEQLIVLAEE